MLCTQADHLGNRGVGFFDHFTWRAHHHRVVWNHLAFGNQSIRANIPPQERRGIVLIDPPFEKPDEFQTLIKQMQEWKKRWATGCFMIWYPIKAGQPIAALHKAATELGINRTWVSEYLLQKRDMTGGLNGAGLLIFNTPFGIPEKIEGLAQELCNKMEQGWIENRYLVGD